MQKQTIFLIVATRKTQEQFYTDTSTGKSYTALKSLFKQDFYPFQLHLILFAKNQRGLSSVYNQAIEHVIHRDGICVFMHDDVDLRDFWWANRIDESLKRFDIVGVAGCIQRTPRQPAWCFYHEQNTINPKLKWLDHSLLSGVLGHKKSDLSDLLAQFGAANQEVKLLDGVLLACRIETLRQTGLRFDPQFDFHFYDLDFCRHAEQLGLKMGTCDVSIIHDSSGGMNLPTWKAGLKKYRAKWQD